VYYKAPQASPLPLQSIRYVINALVDRIAEREAADHATVLAQVADRAGVPPAVQKRLFAFLTPDLETAAPLTDVTSSRDVLHHLAPLIQHILAAVPTTIVIDDVQWIDRTSIEILSGITETGRNVAVVLIGRSETVDFSAVEAADHRWLVEPLTPEESARLLPALLPPQQEIPTPPHFTEWALSWAQGSPFALAEAARMLHQHHRFEQYLWDKEKPPPGSMDPATWRVSSLDDVSDQRIRNLPPLARRLVQILALAAPPVDPSSLDAIPDLSTEEINAALAIATDHGVLVEDAVDGSITFQHDRLEHAAQRTIEDRTVVAAAVALLEDEAAAGKRNSSYTLARYLAIAVESPGTGTTGTGPYDTAAVARLVAEAFPVPRRVEVLEANARQMLATFAPEEAARFVCAAESIFERYPVETASLSRIALYDYGHTAAFLTDNGPRMSRYYTRLRGRVDRLTVNRLRELWVTRCYDRMWIVGAWRIGRIILSDLGALPTGNEEIARSVENARRALTPRLLRRAERALRRSAVVSGRNDADETTRQEEQIVGRTAIRMLLPTLSVAPETTPLFAWIILRNADRYGVSPVTLLGLVYWSFSLSTGRDRTATFRRISRLSRFIVNTLEARSERWSHETAMAIIYGEILFTDWPRNTDDVRPRMFRLYERGVASRSTDAAGHAVSLYCQWLLMRGFPLDDVYRVMERYRQKTAALGHMRTATSIVKYQQAVEVLLGRTRTSDRLSGSLIDDADIESELREKTDTLALYGYYILRLIVAVYHGIPRDAHHAFQQLTDGRTVIARFFDINAIYFFHGIAASQLGLREELRNDIAVLAQRRNAKAAQHRFLALSAERGHHQGHRRTARRRFRRAADLAIRRGYHHEAALIAERDGTLHDDNERLALAVGLYRRWGAARAERRVIALMDSRFTPPVGYIAENAPPSTTSTPARTGDTPGFEGDVEARAETVLERTRSYFHLLLATIPDALFLVDAEGRVLLRNGAAEPFVTGGGDTGETVAPLFNRVIGPLVSRAISDRVRNDAEREVAGQLYALTVTPAALHPGAGTDTGDGEAVGEAVVIARDITVSRERERQLILADRMTSLGMLASTVAHEVSNPNHIVQLNAQVLQMHLQRDTDALPVNRDALGEAVHNVLDGARRIDGVVRRVVDYGRGGAEQRWAPIDPVELCTRVISFTRLLVTRSNDGLVFTRHSPLPQTTAVASLIEQALINLVKNAVEAVGNTNGEIALAVDARERWLVFSVCDQGPGINTTTSDPTEAFVTSRGDAGGGGLGLSIVHSIDENHGGHRRFTRNDRYATIAELMIPHDHGVLDDSAARKRSTAG
jgi:signal transduction histidine kinase